MMLGCTLFKFLNEQTISRPSIQEKLQHLRQKIDRYDKNQGGAHGGKLCEVRSKLAEAIGQVMTQRLEFKEDGCQQYGVLIPLTFSKGSLDLGMSLLL